jgi:hypothetical protein
MNKPIRSISELKNRRRIVNRFPMPTPVTHSDPVNVNESDNNKIEIKNHENMLRKYQIIEIYDRNKIDYDALKEHCEFNMVNTDDVDVSIIIPVRGRESFNKPLVDHLISSMEFFKEKTYSITFVEHNEEPNHRDLCNGSTNHIWIKKIDGGLFNKCLSMNVGALFSNKAKYYLFHDIDLLTDRQFFYNIFQNLSRIPEGSALQSFGGRRVVVMDNNLTIRILRNTTKIEDVVPGNLESPYCTPGAPGGSIFISHDSFYKVGGFDAEFFHSYSCEDSFFYHKLEMTVGVHGCDNPLVDVFHMDHPRTNGSDNPDRHIQSLINSGFRSMSSEDKINLIEHISNNINKLK